MGIKRRFLDFITKGQGTLLDYGVGTYDDAAPARLLGVNATGEIVEYVDTPTTQPKIVSGSFTSPDLTLTRDDSTDFDIDLSALDQSTAVAANAALSATNSAAIAAITDDHVVSGVYNTGSNSFVFTMAQGGTVTVPYTPAIPAVNLTTQEIYEYRDIWAEESGATATNSAQWSFGNGATGFIGLPIDSGWEVESMYFHADNAGANDDITVHLIDFQGTTPSVASPIISTVTVVNAGQGAGNNAYVFQAIASPIAIPANAVLGFRTGTEVGAFSDARVGARLRRLVANVVTNVTLT